MKNPIIYVELKSGYSDNGPAWIGKALCSKTGKMLYFNGKALRALPSRQNFETHVDIQTGERYWVSGVKRIKPTGIGQDQGKSWWTARLLKSTWRMSA